MINAVYNIIYARDSQRKYHIRSKYQNIIDELISISSDINIRTWDYQANESAYI